MYSYILHATGLMQICLTCLPTCGPAVCLPGELTCSLSVSQAVERVLLDVPAAASARVYWVVFEFGACCCSGIECSLVPAVAALPSGYV